MGLKAPQSRPVLQLAESSNAPQSAHREVGHPYEVQIDIDQSTTDERVCTFPLPGVSRCKLN